MRVLVTGGRDFKDGAMVRLALSQVPVGATLVHGAATGADSLAAAQWEAWGHETEAHPADWEAPCRPTCMPGHRRPRGGGTYCPAAGVYRNEEMLNTGVAFLIAFPGGRGTGDMVERCKAAGVPVLYASELAVVAGTQ